MGMTSPNPWMAIIVFVILFTLIRLNERKWKRERPFLVGRVDCQGNINFVGTQEAT